MVMVASGGIWNNQRKKQELKRYQGTDICDRCNEEVETPLHRYWQCRCNTDAKPYTDSEDLCMQAVTQCNTAEAFWLRGLLPAHWTE
eukprot:3895634-Pyramimonas_sp.AAC.1